MRETFRCRMVRPNNGVWDILLVQDTHDQPSELWLFFNTGNVDHGYRQGDVYFMEIRPAMGGLDAGVPTDNGGE
jgi:hypothetical protein